MPKLIANGIEIAYEVYGELDQPVLLLVHGLSMSIPGWPAAFVKAFRDAGFTTVMFDNRDMGHSQKFDQDGVPNFALQVLKNKLRFPVKTVYKLTDMKNDVIALMDVLNIKQAHLLGLSMGGMISQLLAIHNPERFLSLTSIMSTTGERKLPGPKKDILKHLFTGPVSTDIADKLRYAVTTWELIGSPDFPTDQESIELLVQSLMERGMPRAGTARQMLAIMDAKGRANALGNVRLPSLVIHGKEDPLIPVECGINTAESIPNAKLELIEGMGHDLPVQLIPQITNLIIEHLQSV
jgi:pimeloyl-ACP methyl ester carboxylesterase